MDGDNAERLARALRGAKDDVMDNFIRVMARTSLWHLLRIWFLGRLMRFLGGDPTRTAKPKPQPSEPKP